MNFGKKLLFFFIFYLLSGCEQGSLAPVIELNQSRPLTHTVAKGETLYALSFRYDIDFRTLVAINQMHAPYTLKAGQVIRIKSSNSPVPPQVYPKRKPLIIQHYSVKTPLRNVHQTRAWLWPVNGKVAAGFIPSQGKKGINIACRKEERIHAAAAGVVAYAGNGLSGYGNLIIIKHNNEFLTAYGNNSRNLVREGQRVAAGQIIAVSGIIEHRYWGVHFEIRKRGIPVNPLSYLSKHLT